MTLNDLMVPVNPEYDWTKDPDEQVEYVNPVALNNREVQYANAALLITQQLIKINRKVAVTKAAVVTARHALEDFERDLLVKNPPSATAAKSNKLLQTYLWQVVTTAGQQDVYRTLTNAVRDPEQELARLEVEADNAAAALQAIRLAGEHIQTHLSFVKNERKDARRYT